MDRKLTEQEKEKFLTLRFEEDLTFREIQSKIQLIFGERRSLETIHRVCEEEKRKREKERREEEEPPNWPRCKTCDGLLVCEDDDSKGWPSRRWRCPECRLEYFVDRGEVVGGPLLPERQISTPFQEKQKKSKGVDEKLVEKVERVPSLSKEDKKRIVERLKD